MFCIEPKLNDFCHVSTNRFPQILQTETLRSYRLVVLPGLESFLDQKAHHHLLPCVCLTSDFSCLLAPIRLTLWHGYPKCLRCGRSELQSNICEYVELERRLASGCTWGMKATVSSSVSLQIWIYGDEISCLVMQPNEKLWVIHCEV